MKKPIKSPRRRRTAIGWFWIWAILISSCTQPPTPRIKPEKGNLFIELRSRGDGEFNKMHWTGWQRACDWYKKALQVKDDIGVRQKLFESMILLVLREKSFGIRNTKRLEEAKTGLSQIDGRANQIYLRLAIDEVASPHRWEPYVPISGKETHVIKQEASYLAKRLEIETGYYFYLRYIGRYSGGIGYTQYKKVLLDFPQRFPASNLLLETGNFSRNIESTLADYPDFIMLMDMYAQLKYDQGRYQKAEKMFHKITTINQRHPGAWTGLGNIYFWLELFPQAEIFYEKALDINPSFPKALFGKAMCRHYMGDYAGSNQVLREMITRQTTYHGESYYYTAVNHFLQQNEDEVEVNLLKAKQYIPDSVELNSFTGIHYFHRHRLDAAKSHLKQALKHDPDHGDAYFYLGWIAVKNGQNPAADFTSAARSYSLIADRLHMQLAAVKDLQLSEINRKRIKRKRLNRLQSEIGNSLDRLGKILKAYQDKARKAPETIRKIFRKLEQTQRALSVPAS